MLALGEWTRGTRVRAPHQPSLAVLCRIPHTLPRITLSSPPPAPSAGRAGVEYGVNCGRGGSACCEVFATRSEAANIVSARGLPLGALEFSLQRLSSGGAAGGALRFSARASA